MTDNVKIKFYGTTWCPGCRRAKKMLITKDIEFEWINIGEDVAGREFVMEVNNGYRSVPTIVFPDGDILVEPSNAELAAKLSQL
jgi:mycoredoxin